MSIHSRRSFLTRYQANKAHGFHPKVRDCDRFFISYDFKALTKELTQLTGIEYNTTSDLPVSCGVMMECLQDDDAEIRKIGIPVYMLFMRKPPKSIAGTAHLALPTSDVALSVP